MSFPEKINLATTTTASQQHQQEQELLANFAIPNPPSNQPLSEASDEIKSTSSGAPRTLWMGDLDPWLDEPSIENLWWQILQKKVTVKLIRPRVPKQNFVYGGLAHSGYCFIEFETFEDAKQALSLNGKLLPDVAIPSQTQFPNNPDNQKKYFRLNWASGATLSAPILQTPEYSLFVGDLSASTTEAHLLAFFQKLFPDSVKTVRVMTDPVNGKSRCFGFVRFSDELERQRALREMNGVWFGGRPLRVALAAPRHNKKFEKPDVMYMPPFGFAPVVSVGIDQNPAADETASVGNDEEKASVNSAPPLSTKEVSQTPVSAPSDTPAEAPVPTSTLASALVTHSSTTDSAETILDPSPHSTPRNGSKVSPAASVVSSSTPLMSHQGQPFNDPNNTTVFVGGLSSEVSEQTLLTLFKSFGIIQQVKIPPGKNCGFVKYSTREEAEDAIASMQGYIIGGNRVRLSWGRVNLNHKKFHQQQQQVAQAAQMQAAVALSMGYDPAGAMAAVAVAGYPPPPPGPLHHPPPPPPHMHPHMHHPHIPPPPPPPHMHHALHPPPPPPGLSMMMPSSGNGQQYPIFMGHDRDHFALDYLIILEVESMSLGDNESSKSKD